MCMECSEKVYKSLTAVVRAAERAEGACGEAFMHAKCTNILIIHVVFVVNTRIKEFPWKHYWLFYTRK